MSFRLLSFIFKLGKIFALTPPSTVITPPTLGQKLYTILFFAVLTTSVVMSFISKDFYKQYIHIKVVLCFMDDLSLYVLNCYSIIVLGLFRRTQWKLLLENLKSTTYLIQVKSRKTVHIPYYFGFIFITLFYCVSSGYVIYTGVKIDGMLYLKQDLINHVQMYMGLYNKFLYCVISNMLLSRYRGLKYILLTYIKSKNENSQFPTLFMKNIEYTMCSLKKTVDLYNDMFAWPTFFIISFTILEILNMIDYSMFYNQQMELLDNIVLYMTLLIWIFVTLKKTSLTIYCY
jgi:hypothetical protein